MAGEELPEFHPLTAIRDWPNGQAFRLADALSGVVCFGATGSGKTSGPAKHLALGYLAHDFGGVVLCAKKEEREQWEDWAEQADRSDDLVIFDASGEERFNFLDWEATREGEGGGLSLNIVALLDEIALALAGGAGASDGTGGDNKFFEDALHHMNTNLVELPIFAGLPVSLPLMRSIVNTAPQSMAEVSAERWQVESACAAILREADQATKDADRDTRDDFEECQNYWVQEFPTLSEKTRSIITLSFSMLVRPFITRPLRKLFSTDTTITPEDAFDGKIIIIDLPVQEFRLAGRVANLAWKYCFQVATLRRAKLPEGFYLRPVFLWADEAQNFATDFDAEYQAVARSAGGCTVYLVQTREALRSVLRSDDRTAALLANLQAKFFCQNSGETNEWAAKLLGEHWTETTSKNVGQSGQQGGQTTNTGITRSMQRRHYVEPSRFTTLKRGGPVNEYQVDTIVYNGGAEYPGIDDEGRPCVLPYRILTFNQKK